jgi:VanZ family protein
MLGLLRFAFWAAALFAFAMAVLPQPPHLPGDPSDKIQHIIAFLVLALLASLAYRGVRLAAIGLGLSAFGAAIEVAQSIPALHRDADIIDWCADTLAAALVLALVALRRRRSGGQLPGGPGEQQG